MQQPCIEINNVQDTSISLKCCKKTAFEEEIRGSFKMLFMPLYLTLLL